MLNYKFACISKPGSLMLYLSNILNYDIFFKLV